MIKFDIKVGLLIMYNNTEIFNKALNSVETLYKEYVVKQANLSPNDFCIYRDALIQRFEYTFELSWKIIKQFIKSHEIDLDDVELESKKGLFRVAARIGLIKNTESWFTYLWDRNLTSHTYDEDYANDIFADIPNFIDDCNFLLEKMNQYAKL